MAEIILDDMNFEEEVLMSSTPVLVDFPARCSAPSFLPLRRSTTASSRYASITVMIQLNLLKSTL